MNTKPMSKLNKPYKFVDSRYISILSGYKRKKLELEAMETLLLKTRCILLY